MAIFYSNFTVIVCFLVIFVIIIIKITKIIIIIIIETIIIIIKKNSAIRARKTSFLTSKKEDQVARIGVRGGGLGDSGNARKKTFFFYWCLPLGTTGSIHDNVDDEIGNDIFRLGIFSH